MGQPFPVVYMHLFNSLVKRKVDTFCNVKYVLKSMDKLLLVFPLLVRGARINRCILLDIDCYLTSAIVMAVKYLLTFKILKKKKFNYNRHIGNEVESMIH